ncbi:LysR substrate-binding domain-containing protein [Sphaerisporangium perillae]|uniref:LysR substrate-binding domain-containing protein n=1 Tax=Sphaerisporangium perillae TaxID=2935860 RepID=UPI00200FC6ED|nr:LysR substrate-binding domain-containing protein [Sphaerisporangium perillae]
MTLTQLRTFLAVVETGSVKSAAKRLVVTESAVSASLVALQRSLGLQLVRPAGRGLELTESGETYAGYVRQALGLLEAGQAAAAGESDPEGGELRIAAVTPAGEQLVPRFLRGFRQAHPRVRVTLRIGNRERVHELLDHREVDLLIGGRPPKGRAVLAVRPNELVVVTPGAGSGWEEDHDADSPQEHEAGGTEARDAGGPEDHDAGGPEDHDAGAWEERRRWLAGRTWLLREPGSGTRATAEVLLDELNISPPTLTIGSNTAIREAVIAGLGVSLMSRDAVIRDLASGAMAVRSTPGTPLRRDWHLVAHPGRLPATATLFVRYLLSGGEFTDFQGK